MKPFDYSKYMKNNLLLKENYGGYRDIEPLKEEDHEEDLEEGMDDLDPGAAYADWEDEGGMDGKGWQDETDEDYEHEAYDQAEEKFRAAVGMLKDANMDDETIHDLFMSILGSYEEQQGEYDAMNQDMMEDNSMHGLDEYLDEAEKQDKEKEEPKQSKSNTKDNAGRLKGKMDKFKGDKAKQYQPIHSRVYKESRKRF